MRKRGRVEARMAASMQDGEKEEHSCEDLTTLILAGLRVLASAQMLSRLVVHGLAACIRAYIVEKKEVSFWEDMYSMHAFKRSASVSNPTLR